MSSSNNYCGIVYRTKKFADACLKNPEGEQLYNAFKDHWLKGYSPFFGKDILFARPDEALTLHIRHSHADSGQYEPEDSNKQHSAKESCWKKWKDGYVYRVPTSDSWLIYAVNENRDAMVMDYIHKAHEVTQCIQYMDQYIEITYSFLSYTKCNQMPYDEDPFDDKWLIENQNQ
ncbi:type II toxin-antitoxin system YafO family toxin [Proteus mirabilis]|uniref:type II toxin-antitoxin system YafO family toxin n=1 Tax=Proteus mirabilis TaxID=584 RepID=UPI0007CC7B56|nr:type II toxin-antitoxin system YafO family toxin [Proteus mirabilis]MBC6385844.1 hypothetical protein [Proteus mirabilis]MBS3866914.1 type II toxin-antitoxin system YafO family toxin [Proteus mirabilis]OAH95759.1 hypothetical protein AZH52_01605 [Proteus mirabilis]